MKKRRKLGKRLGTLFLSAAIICSAVLSAFAEEPDADSSDAGNVSAESSGTENQELKSQGEETQGEEKQDSTSAVPEEKIQKNLETEGKSAESEEARSEEAELEALANETEEAVTESSKPRVTVESITWDGGQLKIPVDLGSYTSDEIWLKICIGFGENTETYHLELEGNFAVCSPISKKYNDQETFWTKEGNYEARLEFYLSDNSGTAVNEDSFTIVVPTSSEMWQADVKEIKFDGSQDLTFSFKNGTNYYALQNIEYIELFMWKDSTYPNPILSGDAAIEYDMAKGTLTLYKGVVTNALKEAVKEAQQKGIEKFPTRAFVETFAVTSSGEETMFNVIKDENGMITPAWELDLTEFDWTQEELKIVPEVTDYSYTKGDRDGATIECTGELEDFESVYMDNVLVDSSNYTLKSGSTILTFMPEYLNTLSVGKHTVTLNYTYGSVDTELTVQERTNSGGSGSAGRPKPSRPKTPSSSTTPEGSSTSATPAANPTSTAVTPSAAAPAGATTPASAAVPTGTANTGSTSGNTASVQTGDDSSAMLWILAAMFALGTCGVLGWKRYSGKI